MVPKEQLSRVAGLNQTIQGINIIVAPALGALVVSLLPMGQIMLIDVATAALAVLPLLFVIIPQPEKATTDVVTVRGVLADVGAGFRYLANWPGMLLILGMATMINFFLNPTGMLLPLLITRHFDGGPWHFSAMESAFGVGMIAGGLILSVWGGFKKRIVTSMVFLVGMGISALITGFAPSSLFVMAVAGNTLFGMMNPLVNGPIFALLQEKIAPEMQGRVFTLVSALAGLISPIGMALAAPVADNLGVQVWWWIGGAFCMLMGASALFIRPIMTLESNGGGADPARPATAVNG
jgi:DHA3 family macrolide efflux protein-like MFS transporter